VKLYQKITVYSIDKDDSVCEPVGVIVLFVGRLISSGSLLRCEVLVSSDGF
jgi:hypothetical protein